MMLQNTTREEQAMGFRNTHVGLPPNHTGVVFRTREEEEATGEDWTTVDGDDEIPADDTQGDHSTVSTECSHDDKKVFSSPPSPLLGTATDPTSIPSGTLDDLDLERKCTLSPLNSNKAVHGSDSVHSDLSISSSSSTGCSDSSREGVPPITVNAGKAKDIGGHFGESSMNDASTSRFHDPTNSWEARHIRDKIRQANDTLDGITRHPEQHLRNHGSPYQLSARPKEEPAILAPPNETADDEDDDKPKVQFFSPPDSYVVDDIEEGCVITARPRKRQRSGCCTIM